MAKRETVKETMSKLASGLSVRVTEPVSASHASNSRQPPPHSIMSATPTPVSGRGLRRSEGRSIASHAASSACSIPSVFSLRPLAVSDGRSFSRIMLRRRNSIGSMPSSRAAISNISSRVNVACGFPNPRKAPDGGFVVWTQTPSMPRAGVR